MYKLTDGDRFGRSHLARLARPKATPQSNLAYIYIKLKKKRSLIGVKMFPNFVDGWNRELRGFV